MVQRIACEPERIPGILDNFPALKQKIAILGSTGSIGKQTLEIVRQFPDVFEVEVLTAQNSYKELILQAIEFIPNSIVIANQQHYREVSGALASYPIKIYAGDDAISQVVDSGEIDIVLVALVGIAGLKPTIQAIKAGKRIALANKETLVVAGDLITRLLNENRVMMVPVDSEHSAILQCIEGENKKNVEKVLLTASGGPFLGKDLAYLEKVTPGDALKHPNWSMGDKITIDSATMMNKGFEVIEAKWLFGLEPGQIDVVIHPQSVIHSMVQFTDGSIKAQMGVPDMRIPIQYALTYPVRFESRNPRLDFSEAFQLSFEIPDKKVFRCLSLAYEALNRGGNIPCALNAANEIAVQAFLEHKIKFTDIPYLAECAISSTDCIKSPSLDDYLETDREIRAKTKSLITN